MTRLEELEKKYVIAVARARAAIDMLKMIDKIRNEAEEQVNKMATTVTELYTEWREEANQMEKNLNGPH